MYKHIQRRTVYVEGWRDDQVDIWLCKHAKLIRVRFGYKDTHFKKFFFQCFYNFEMHTQ